MSSSVDLQLGTAALAAPPRARTVDDARNIRIQYLRGAAASSVVLFHASTLLSQQSGIVAFRNVFDDRFGLYGVAIFFAISGYLMAHLVRTTGPYAFLAHRILRIYPIFFLIAGLSYIASRFTGLPFALDVLGLTLVPAGARKYPLGVEWTLVFETTYYVLLFLLAWARLQRFLEAIAIGWIAAILLTTLLAPAVQTGALFPIHLILLSPANVAFAGGLLLPALIKRGLVPPVSALLVVPFALAYDLFDLQTNRWIGGVAAICVVGWAVQGGAQAGDFGRKILMALGNWSYALYLCHVPIMLTVYLLWPVGSVAPWWLAVALSFLAAALLGPLDVGLYRRLRRWSDAANPQATRFAVIAYVATFAGIAAFGSFVGIREGMHTRRVDATLSRIGSKALASPEAANARIAELGLAPPPSVTGTFEQIDALPMRQVALRGWVLDREAPSERFRVIAFCGGRRIEPAVTPHRWRPDVVQALGRDDLRKARIGFTMIPVTKLPCAPAATLFVIAFNESGNAAVLSGEHRAPVVDAPAP